jgi:hypothetical protein
MMFRDTFRELLNTDYVAGKWEVDFDGVFEAVYISIK